MTTVLHWAGDCWDWDTVNPLNLTVCLWMLSRSRHVLNTVTLTECFKCFACKSGSMVRDNSKRCPRLFNEFIHEFHGLFSLCTKIGTKSHILRSVIYQYKRVVVPMGTFDKWSKKVERYNLEILRSLAQMGFICLEFSHLVASETSIQCTILGVALHKLPS